MQTSGLCRDRSAAARVLRPRKTHNKGAENEAVLKTSKSVWPTQLDRNRTASAYLCLAAERNMNRYPRGPVQDAPERFSVSAERSAATLFKQQEQCQPCEAGACSCRVAGGCGGRIRMRGRRGVDAIAIACTLRCRAGFFSVDTGRTTRCVACPTGSSTFSIAATACGNCTLGAAFVSVPRARASAARRALRGPRGTGPVPAVQARRVQRLRGRHLVLRLPARCVRPTDRAWR